MDKFRAENLTQTLNFLNQYERLEIVVVPAAFNGNDNSFAVVERGRDPKKPPEISISNEATSYSRLILDDYSNSMRRFYRAPVGHPGELFANNYSADSSEASHISNALCKDIPNPIDYYHLHSLGIISSQKLKNCQEVFDLLLQYPLIMESTGADEWGAKSSLEAQKRLYDVLFTDGVISQAIAENPEYFITHGPLLKQQLVMLQTQGNIASYTFLIYLIHTTGQHLAQAMHSCTDENRRMQLEAAVAAWPVAHDSVSIKSSVASYFGHAFNSWREREQDVQKEEKQNQIDIAAYLLSVFSNDAHALHPAEMSVLNGGVENWKENVATLAQILELASKLKFFKEKATLPIVATQGLVWVQQRLAPYIDGIEDSTRNTALDHWINSQDTLVQSYGMLTASPWSRVAGQPLVWEKEGTVVDLGTQQVLCYKGHPIHGVDTSLPIEVTQHADYRHLFGEQVFRALVRPSGIAGQLIYEFQDKTKARYRILINSSAGSLSIERAFPSSIDSQENKESQLWYLFSPTALSKAQAKIVAPPSKSTRMIGNLSRHIPGFGKENVVDNGVKAVEELVGETLPAVGVEKQLMSGGVWTHPHDKRQGRAFLGQSGLNSSEDQLMNISLTGAGKILKMRAFNNDLEVVHGAEQAKDRYLTCLPEEQLLYLRQAGKRAVTEIRLLDQGLSLQRNSAHHPWCLSGDKKLSGAVWSSGAKGAAQRLFQSLKVPIESFALPLRHNDQTVLLLWPQPAKTHERLYYTEPPLKVVVSDDGTVLSSAGGYLALAYQFAAAHDYVRAQLYLDKARTAKFDNNEELSAVLVLKEQMSQLRVTSVRSAAIKLKGLLAIRRILLEQTTALQYDPDRWKDYRKAAEEIAAVKTAYDRYLERSPFSQKVDYFKGAKADIALTSAENEEIAQLEREAMTFASSMKSRVENLNTESIQLNTDVPTSTEIENVLPMLVARMAHSSLKESDALHILQGQHLSKDLIIKHFFALRDLIVLKRLQPRDLQMLFVNLPEKDENAASEVINKVASSVSFDVARRLLLVAAASNIAHADDENALKPIHNRARKLQKALPEGVVSLAIDGAWSYIKHRLAKGNVERLKAFGNSSSEMQLLKQFSDLANQLKGDHSLSGIGLNGFQESHALGDGSIASVLGQMLPQQQNERHFDSNKLREALQQDPALFGVKAGPFIDAMQESTDIQKALGNASPAVPIDTMVENTQQKTGINLIETLRKTEVKKRIDLLEKSIKERQVIKLAPDAYVSSIENANFPDSIVLMRHFTESETSSLQNNLHKLAESLTEKFNMRHEAVEDAASDKLKQGLTAASTLLKAKIDNKFTVAVTELDALANSIADKLEEQQIGLFSKQFELMQHLRSLAAKHPASLPLDVCKALKHRPAYSNLEIIALLKQSYQHLELKDAQTVQLLTVYLMHQAAKNILSGEVQNILKNLTILKAQGVSQTDNDWVSATTKLHALVGDTLNFRRYLDGQGHLKDPRLDCKVLVMEAQQGIIATEEQLKLVQDIVDNPANWYELKVGLGKTSVVFPLILMLLIEKGFYPAAIVKDELMQQNLDSLNRATRDLLQKAGVEFNLHFNDAVTALTLQENYLRLLEVQANRGYPITSLTSIIAIDQKMQVIQETLLDKQAALLLEKKLELAKECDELEEQLYYLSKIKDKLNMLFIDEADDILNVITEHNIGRGKIVPLNPTIQNCMGHLVRVVFQSKHLEITKLKNALLNGEQASLGVDNLKEKILPAWVKELLKDSDFQAFAGLPQNPPIDVLTAYICTIFNPMDAERIEKQLPDFSDETKQKLGAVKHLIQKTLLPSHLARPGIDVGIKGSDGFQVGPHIGGNEINGVVFSDEYDLLANHYLSYACRLPDGEFTVKGLHYIQNLGPNSQDLDSQGPNDQGSGIYDRWVRSATKAGMTPIQFLNAPENFKERLTFLRLQVIAEKRIKRFENQIVFNVQDICHGRIVGGMTGTLNRECLPNVRECLPNVSDKHADIDSSHAAVAQVILEAGLLKEPEVSVVGDSQDAMLLAMGACARDASYKAIINQGYWIADNDTENCVKELRRAAPERSFVYIDSSSRTAYLWEAGLNKPRSVTKDELKKLASQSDFKKQACFYFGPSDTRGTDFVIPPGKGMSFISPKCSKGDLAQTLGRLRGAGTIHSMDFVVSDSVATRIAGSKELSKDLTYAMLVDDIKRQELAEQTGKNLKKISRSYQGIMSMGTRQMIYGHQPIMDSNSYWDPRKPELRLLNNYVCKMLAEVVLGEKSWWDEVREADLKADFAISKWEDTAAWLKHGYDAQIAKVELLEEQIKKMENIEVLVGLLGVTIGDQERAWVDQRKDELLKQTSKMRDQLKSAYDTALSQLKDKNQTLPFHIPGSDAGIPTAQAQVQEQIVQAQVEQQAVLVQEQQLQQRKVKPVKDNPAVGFSKGYVSHPIGGFAWKDSFSNEKRALINFWRSEGNFCISENFSDVFNALNGIDGDLTACRILVKDGNIHLINRNDYHQESSIQQKKSTSGDVPSSDGADIHNQYNGTYYNFLNPMGGAFGNIHNQYDAIYSLVNASRYGQSLVLNQRHQDLASTRIEDLSPKLEQLVRAKWFLGITNYTDAEKVVLEAWLKSFQSNSEVRENHRIYLENFASPQQMELLSSIVHNR